MNLRDILGDETELSQPATELLLLHDGEAIIPGQETTASQEEEAQR